MLSNPNTENAIEVRIDDIAQLFNMLDPFPFRERDLDKDAEEYIVGWAREFPLHSILKLIIHAPEGERRSERARHVEPALRHYFEYRADLLDRDLKDLFRIGRVSLLIGAAALAVCVITSRAVSAAIGPGNISRFVEEGLVILGWVANWKPIQIFLYDWWPLKRRRDLYRRLAAAKVEFRSTQKD